MNSLLIRFPDQSPNYTYGVEFGRILARLEDGQEVVGNKGFPVRTENKEVLVSACSVYGYKPVFTPIPRFPEYSYFTATKSTKLN